MVVWFEDQKLNELCCNQRNLQKKYGQKQAKKITRRLAELSGAKTLEDMRFAPGNCHELKGNRQGQLAVELSDGYRLVFVPHHDPVPKKSDGGIDWHIVTELLIKEIVNYHE